jgi:hypothetical protein
VTTCRECETCHLEPTGDVMRCAIVYDRLAERFRDAVLAVLDACNRNPITVTVMLARAAGLTEQETSELIGTTKQTISRHLTRIARTHPHVARQLRRRWALVEGLTPPQSADPGAVTAADAGRCPPPLPGSYLARGTRRPAL